MLAFGVSGISKSVGYGPSKDAMAIHKEQKLSEPRALTNVSILKTLSWAIILTGVLYALAFYLKGLLYQYLWERSWVQPVSTFAFWSGIAFLALKTFQIRSQNAAFDQADEALSTFAAKSTITADDGDAIAKQLKSLPDAVQGSMLVMRLRHMCSRLRNTRSVAEVDNIFQMMSEGDAARVESSYTPVRFLFALIPLLGFVGNVLGVGNGIGRFSGVLEQAQSFDSMRPALKFAATSLANAFDTTFLALFYSAIILLVNAIVQHREEKTLAAVDEYCIDTFVSRIHIVSTDVKELMEHETRLTSDVIDKVETGLKTLTDVGFAPVAAQLKTVEEQLTSLERQVCERLESVGKKVNDGNALVVLTLIEKLALLGQKIDEASKHVAPTPGSLEAIKNLSATLDELRGMLHVLQPAIESMSAEIAKEINNVLSMLLRATIVAHNWHKSISKDAAEGLHDEALMERIFGDAKVARRGV